MSVWDAVVGQPEAVAALRAAVPAPVHAYLLAGPPGSGKRAAAQAFAAALLCPDGGCGVCSACERVRAEVHPDVVVSERVGPYISVEQARQVAHLAARSPVEGGRKVLVLTDFHLVEKAAPALLKTIEEPPASTVFVVLADHVPPELVTIASRCVRVDFGPVPTDALEGVLLQGGADATTAKAVSAAARGSLDRARLLLADPAFAARADAWRSVPARLDATGATIAILAGELLASAETVLEPVRAAQAASLAEAVERAERYGERARRDADVEKVFRREERRARTDELRSGMAALAATYRDRLAVATTSKGAGAALAAIAALDEAAQALSRNPNETLLLQALLARLSALSADLPYSPVSSPE